MSEHLFDLFRLELLADLAPEYLDKGLLPDYFKHLQTASPSVEIFKQCGTPFIRSPVQLPEFSAFQQIPLPADDMSC